MKTLNKLLAICAVAFLLMLMAPHKSMAQEGYVSDQEFYDNLQQYGTWVQDDQYGDVWVPDVDDDFRPYATNGYWVQTDYGNTWVSDYPWGWATFHYGRWRYDDYYGWEWIPGHEWAPAWVSWRQGGGYYGWAPMGPGISISISLGGGGYTDNHYWVYAPQRYITSRYISRYYAPPTRVNVIVRNTTIIRNTYVYNNRTYITGPRPTEIQRITRRPVNVYKINDAPRPGSISVGVKTRTLNIYRPQITKAPDARPARVVSATAYKNDHPNEGIGRRGGIGYNRNNAVKLATVARTQNPDNRVVKVNPRPNTPPANNPATPIAGHNRNNEPKTNPVGQPNTPQQGGDRRNHANEPANQPQQGGAQKPQTGGNEPVRAGEARGQHRTVPTVSQPQQQQQNQQPAQQPNQAERRQRGHNPAVNPPAQNNADQAQKQQQQLVEQQRQQQAQQQQKEQQQQAQQAARQQAQEQKQQAQQTARQQRQQVQEQQRQQQQQAQQAARQQAQEQQRQQQQQAQQAARQQAQEQQRQQQQQAQQAARQQAQEQQRQQQQQAQQQRQQAQQQQRQQQQQAARQQAQQQQRQQQQQARQQQQQQKQEEQQKQNPPR